jgi:hypothetical protein
MAGADAAASATLTVQLVPGAVSAGEPALAVATFRNLSSSTLPNARVTLHFPKGLSVVSAPGCAPISASTVNVVCSFGDVPRGATREAFVSARLASHLSQNQNIRVGFALRVGPGFPQPIETGASATVLASTNAANRGSCRKVPVSLSATFNQQVTSLVHPPTADPGLHLPCTPLAVGVSTTPPGLHFITQQANVDVPALSKPSVVKLVFPNEKLPDEKLVTSTPNGIRPSFDNPDPLWRVDNDGKRFVVPLCKPGNKFPAGWHSCIVSVIVNPNDPGHDWDSGTITLLVQGTGFGDPKFQG